MKIVVNDKVLADKYSKYAEPEFKIEGQPIVSFPFKIEDAPENCVSYCFTLFDYDAVPLSGFTWIHWLVANVEMEMTDIFEDFSRNPSNGVVQGKNSNISPFVDIKNEQITHGYIGPTPPDKDHKYTLMVYALDTYLDLKDGFYLNELHDMMSGHILAHSKTVVIGRV